MATLITTQTGNFSDTATTWRSSISGFDSLTNSSVCTVTTSQLYSANVTPGVVTVDAIGFQVDSRAASPSGTMTVTLRNTSLNSDVVSVTFNVSDLDSNGNGWYQVEFASQLLLTATTYAVGISTSVSSQVTLRGTSTSNWNTFVRSTTDGTIGAGDTLMCLGKITGAGATSSFTLTMDRNSTTAIGNMHVGKYCTVSHSTGASTELRNGNSNTLNIWGGGTYNIGTNGSPVTSGNTALLTIGSTTAVTSGIICNSGFTFNAYGATVGTVQTYASSDVASAQAVVNVVADTNWAANDLITVSGTATNSRQAENMTISSIATLAVTCTGNFANAHNGTNAGGFDTRAEVLHFTRNVKIQSTNTTSATSIYLNMIGSAGAFSAQYVEFINLGSVTANKRGLDFGGSGGTHSVTYCAFRDSGNTAGNTAVVNFGQSGGAITFSNNNIRGAGATTTIGIRVSISGGSFTANSNWIVCNNTSAQGLQVATLTIPVAFTATRVTDTGIGIAINSINPGGSFDLSSSVVHGCTNATGGFSLSAANSSASTSTILPNVTASSLTVWGCSRGVVVSVGGDARITNLLAFGSTIDISTTTCWGLSLITPTLDAGPSGRTGGPSQSTTCWTVTGSTDASIVGGSIGNTNAYVNNFSVSNGVGQVSIIAQNCNVATPSSTFVSGQVALSPNSFLRFQHEGAAGTNIAYLRNGTIQRNTANKDTGFTSCTQMSPTSGATMANGESLSLKAYFPVTSGAGRTVTVRMEKDGSYTGANPKLTLNFLGSAITGPTAQSITTSYADYTIVASNGAITEDGVIELVVECDGSAGNIFIQTTRAS